MSVTLHWFYLPIVLVILPIIYAYVRKPGGDWDMQIDTMLVAAVCWCLAIGLTVGHFLG